MEKKKKGKRRMLDKDLWSDAMLDCTGTMRTLYTAGRPARRQLPIYREWPRSSSACRVAGLPSCASHHCSARPSVPAGAQRQA